MEFTQAIKAGFQKYIDFTTRSCRSEYWFWALFVVIASIVLAVIDAATYGIGPSGSGPLGSLFSLVTFIPGIAVAVRRLHDIDKSGWWLLLAFIPLIGWIVLIVWFATKGTEGPNRFGEDPLLLPEEV